MLDPEANPTRKLHVGPTFTWRSVSSLLNISCDYTSFRFQYNISHKKWHLKRAKAQITIFYLTLTSIRCGDAVVNALFRSDHEGEVILLPQRSGHVWERRRYSYKIVLSSCFCTVGRRTHFCCTVVRIRLYSLFYFLFSFIF